MRVSQCGSVEVWRHMFHSVGLWWFGDACFTVWVCGGLATHVSHFGSVVVR